MLVMCPIIDPGKHVCNFLQGFENQQTQLGQRWAKKVKEKKCVKYT